jgi:Acetyltransferase (GNAT) domain
VVKFIAEANPEASRVEELAALSPANPFATPAYLEAEQSFGAQPWLLGCVDGGNLIYGCFAFLRCGRLNRRLTIPSLPAADESFWSGLLKFNRLHGITILELNSFASPALSIPALRNETRRIGRHEFLMSLDVPEPSLFERMRINHRQSALKGIKSGIEACISSEPAALDDHLRLIASSMARRQSRGESVSYQSSLDGLRPYIETGFCRLFLAVLGSETVSSMMVARSALGAYLYTSGTSPSGMLIGASHFLIHAIAVTSRREGARIFNLGGATNLNSGLAQYKRHFGAEGIALEAAEFYVGSPWRRALGSIVHYVRHSPP